MNRRRKPEASITVLGNEWHKDDYFCVRCGLRTVWRLEETDFYLCLACSLTFRADDVDCRKDKVQRETEKVIREVYPELC
jgi:hypothetical protein